MCVETGRSVEIDSGISSETGSSGSDLDLSDAPLHLAPEVDEIVPRARRGLVDSLVVPAQSRADPPPGGSPRLRPELPGRLGASDLLTIPTGFSLGLDIFAKELPPLSPTNSPPYKALLPTSMPATMQSLVPPQSPFARLRSRDGATPSQELLSVFGLPKRVAERISSIRESGPEPSSGIGFQTGPFDSLNVLLQSIQDQARAAQERLRSAQTPSLRSTPLDPAQDSNNSSADLWASQTSKSSLHPFLPSSGQVDQELESDVFRNSGNVPQLNVRFQSFFSKPK